LVKSLFTNPSDKLVSITVQPSEDQRLAIVMNKNGNQALWIARKNNLKDYLHGSPAISFANGSVFDPAWSPDGNHLLFSADFTGVMQVYEYDLQTGSIIQITNAPYNAFEASYSPDGSRIAFIIQKGNERLPVVLSRNKFYDEKIDLKHKNITA